MVASPFLRWFCPTWKILFDLCGITFGGAGRKEFKRLLQSGKSCVLVTGGFHEATITCPGTDRIYLNNGRKGFVRYALREGYSLTPVYGFGETDTFSNVQGMWGFRYWLNSGTFQIPAVWGLGHWLCPILPRREKLRIVYGTPLHLPRIPNPTQEEVDKYHAMYIEKVRDLYDEYKPYDRHLEVW
ncbi:hypothetical protein FOZ60_007158 [Perkinsus olseni]|nr:hypothetical protein FOZ60_007158 [Perkinsus olseni]